MSTVTCEPWPVHPDRLELPRLTCLLIDRGYCSAAVTDIVRHAVLEREVRTLAGNLIDLEDLDVAREQLRQDLLERCQIISRLTGIAIHQLTIYPPELDDDFGDDIPFLGDRLIHEC